jgi:hypothetical protein
LVTTASRFGLSDENAFDLRRRDQDVGGTRVGQHSDCRCGLSPVLLLTGIIHWLFTRDAVHPILVVRCPRRDALMDFMEFVVNGGLSLLVLLVHPNDQVVRRFGPVEVGVVAVTE